MPLYGTFPFVRFTILCALCGLGVRSPYIQALTVRGSSSKRVAAESTPMLRINAGRSIAHDCPQVVVKTQAKRDFTSRQIVVPVENQGLTISRMDYPEEIGRRIRTLREELTLTLADVSRRTKDVLSRKRIQNYEAGIRTPGPAEAVLLAKALGTRPAYIMAIDDTQLPIHPIEESLVKYWRKLNEKDRMAYYRQLETMALQSADPASDDRVARAVGKPPEVATKKKRKTSPERRP